MHTMIYSIITSTNLLAPNTSTVPGMNQVHRKPSLIHNKPLIKGYRITYTMKISAFYLIRLETQHQFISPNFSTKFFSC